MKQGNIIFLDGSPSAGKTTIAAAIQEASEVPYFYASVDMFVQMMPKRWISFTSALSGKEGFEFALTQNENGRSEIKFGAGPMGENLIQGYLLVVKGLASAGNHVIADGVITKKEWLERMKGELKEFKLLTVCLFAPLGVLEKREKERWEPEGMARGRFDEVYSLKEEYDLIIDTSKISPAKAAREILAAKHRDHTL